VEPANELRGSIKSRNRDLPAGRHGVQSSVPSFYIHIPFCKKKCNYCDFVSYAGKEELIDEYVNTLIIEIEALTQFFTNDYFSFNVPLPMGEGKRVRALKTIYFGGGTPTLLEPKHFDKIITTIIRHSSFVIRHSEISIESNPATADKEKLKALRKLGINRLSIGAQSFNDQHLQTLGRIHNARDIFRFYADARSAGFKNINLDLIFSLPGQTLAEWKKELQAAIDLKPNHISTYNLQIEENTPLYLRQTANRLQLPGEEEELKMYEYAIETLTSAGFNHYEISNFAKPGFECKHNINYWENGNYIGVGAGAHSHLNGKRWANPNSIEEYLANHERRFTINDSPDSTDQRETLFMGLRLLEGLSIDKFSGFEQEVAELINDGLLERDGDRYKLSKKGLYLGNLVFEKFV